LKKIKLDRHEQIVVVVPKFCSGPGWVNAPVFVYIEHKVTKQLRIECIQPKERSPDLHTLFAPGAAMCAALIDAVPVEEKNT
jgi:hypothetical protein